MSTGLYPLDRNEFLKKLPEKATRNLYSAESINISLNETLMKLLKKNRDHSKEDKIKRQKNSKKKIWFTKCNGWKNFGD